MNFNSAYGAGRRHSAGAIPTIQSTQQAYSRPQNGSCRRPCQRSFSANSGRGGITLKEPYFSQIINGSKTIEGRINSGQFKNVGEGQTLTFVNGAREVRCTVQGKRIYRSFRDMLEAEGVTSCLPGARSLQEGVNIYNNLPGFAERARQNGVVALQLLLVDGKAPFQSANFKPQNERVASSHEKEKFGDSSEKKRTREEREIAGKEQSLAKEPALKRVKKEEPLKVNEGDKEKEEVSAELASSSSSQNERVKSSGEKTSNSHSSERKRSRSKREVIGKEQSLAKEPAWKKMRKEDAESELKQTPPAELLSSNTSQASKKVNSGEGK